MPTIADCTVALAAIGDSVFAAGTLREGVSLRLVAREHETKVALWSDEAMTSALSDCPSVARELQAQADRFQAMAGATMGALGDRLDETTRCLIMTRLDVRSYEPGEVIIETGLSLSGMHIVGSGDVELVHAQRADGNGAVEKLMPGEFLFPAQILAQGAAPMTALAGAGGALTLFCHTKTARELLDSVVPLVEILQSLRPSADHVELVAVESEPPLPHGG